LNHKFSIPDHMYDLGERIGIGLKSIISKRVVQIGVGIILGLLAILSLFCGISNGFIKHGSKK
jgi:hypothetical protein